MNIKCSRCGAKKSGTEMETEIWFGEHECEGLRPLSEITDIKILRDLAIGTISEEDAFKLFDKAAA